MMKRNRVAFTIVVAAVGVIACLLLAATSAPMPPVAADAPAEAPLSPVEYIAPDQEGPVIFPPGPWPWYAQEEISMDPDPPRVEQRTELCATVVNLDAAEAHPAVLEFGITPLGIGLPFTPVGQAEVMVPAGGEARGCVVWIPPDFGPWCIEALLWQPGNDVPERSLRNVDAHEPLRLDEPHTLVFRVGNPTAREVDIVLEMIPHLTGWEIGLSSDILPQMAPGEVRPVSLEVTPRQELPPDGTPIVDVEAFAAGELIGGLRKSYRPPIVLHRFPDPPYAEREISVDPYPPMAGEPTEICVELRNPTGVPQDVEVQFSWAAFGIGLPFTPINGLRPVHLPPHSLVNECIHWIPPVSGHVCLQVELFMDGIAPQRSQRNLDVAEPLEPGVPHTLVFPVGNPLEREATLTLGLIPHLDGWGLELSQDVLPNVMPGEVRGVALTVTPPDELPEDGTPIVDVEAYVNGELLGGFRKIFRPPVPIHRPGEPLYGESEISMEPYPPRAGEPVEICTDVRNYSDAAETVQVEFSVANFGIGIPFLPIGPARTVELPPHGEQRVCTNYVFSYGGHFCVQVRIQAEGYPVVRSQRNVDVAEILKPGQPEHFEVPVGNPFDRPVTITLALVNHTGWEVSFSPRVIPDALPWPAPPTMVAVDLTPGQDVSDLAENAPVLDLEAYVDRELIGGIRKVFRPPIQLHPFPDPPYAEREITVEPYPPQAGEPTEVCVELRNPTAVPQDVAVRFAWANFGIGLPFTPIDGLRPVHLPPHSVVKECIHWIPPTAGHVCLQVELFIDGYQPQRSQRNIDIDEPLAPGQAHTLTFDVGNPLERPATLTLGLIPHLEGWGLELSQDVLRDMQPGEIRTVDLTVTPPRGQPLPQDETPVVDVEAYAEGRLIGGFRKIHRPPIPLHPFPDPPYAEREITVEPYPPRAGEPTEVCVELRNPTAFPQDVAVRFSWANFGIGIPFTPIDGLRPVHLPPHSVVKECIHWIPPVSGHACLQVELFIDGYEPQRSQRNLDVAEPLQPGGSDKLVFPVGNPFQQPVTITLGLIPHVDGWLFRLEPEILTDVKPAEFREVALTVMPGELPEDGMPIVDVEAHADGRLVGGFRKIYRPPVPIHRPKDPIYAESEIGVDPYPVIPGQPAKLSVEVRNPTDEPRIVMATFSIAPFGIGLPFKEDYISPNPIRIYVPPHGAARGHVVWTPPEWRGKFCVRVELQDEGHRPVWSQRNIDVAEPLRPGEPHSLTFQVGTWPYSEPVTITLGLINHKREWGASLSKDLLVNVQPGEPVSVTLTVSPPEDAELGSGLPILDVEAYVEGRLLGGFRKLDIPPVPLHKPHEKDYAETEMTIEPDPPQVGEEAKVTVELQNNGSMTSTVLLEFGWAQFGMGIPFTTTGMVPPGQALEIGPVATATTWVTWRPVYSGPHCIQVRLQDPTNGYREMISRRNVEVAEPPPCGETRVFTFTVYNDSPFTATVEIGLISFNVPADWEVTVLPSDTLTLGPFDEGVVTVTVRIPCAGSREALLARQELAALQEEAGSVPTIDVEGYVDGELVGGIELQFPSAVPEGWEIYLPLIMKNH